MQIIPIVFATDDKFVAYCSVAICSIKRNASADKDYRIYVFHDSLKTQNIEKLERMSVHNFEVRCMDVSAHIQPDIMYAAGDNYTQPIYFRFLIPLLLPMYDKVLYLDSDVVAATDVAELYEMDIGDVILGAVADLQHPLRKKHTQQQVGLDAATYFNSGVLLINCRTFRQAHIKEKCYELLSSNKHLLMPDQDALNLICLGNVRFLPYRWNLMMSYGKRPYDYKRIGLYNVRYEESLANPGILHYTGAYKPDMAAYLGRNSYFWRYAFDSPWFSELFVNWLDKGNRTLRPQELLDSIHEVMSTGQYGWQGLCNMMLVGFRSRMQYFSLAGRIKAHQKRRL